jgi:DNA repair protein RadC
MPRPTKYLDQPANPVHQARSPDVTYRDWLQCPACHHQIPLAVEGLTWNVRSPSDVADRLLAKLGRLEREELWVLTLNTKNAVMDARCVYRGNVSTSLVRVAELFTEAVRRNGSGVLLAHVHPSGDPTPSPDDLHLTAEALAAGRLLDIAVLDHIVLGNGSYVSLRDRGIRFDRSAG